jgi:hypothetical protein
VKSFKSRVRKESCVWVDVGEENKELFHVVAEVHVHASLDVDVAMKKIALGLFSQEEFTLEEIVEQIVVVTGEPEPSSVSRRHVVLVGPQARLSGLGLADEYLEVALVAEGNEATVVSKLGSYTPQRAILEGGVKALYFPGTFRRSRIGNTRTQKTQRGSENTGVRNNVRSVSVRVDDHVKWFLFRGWRSQ